MWRKCLIAFSFLMMFIPSYVWGCPTNEFIVSVSTPIVFSFEKRNGTGEDTTNTANKRVSISYMNGATATWCLDATCSTTQTSGEALLTMTQHSGSLYRYEFTPPSALLGRFLILRFDETDDVDVTKPCLIYVQAGTHLAAGTKDRTAACDASGNCNSNVEKWNTTDVPTEHTAGYPIVTIKDGTGTGEIDTNTGTVIANGTDTFTVTIGTITISHIIPIQETGIVTANDQFIGGWIFCNKEWREILVTTQGATDTITINGAYATGNPTNGTVCTLFGVR